LVLIVVLSMIVPTAFAGGNGCPGPKCDKVIGNIYPGIDVEYVGPSEVNSDETGKGVVVYTATSDVWANVGGPNSWLTTSFDLWTATTVNGKTTFAYDPGYSDFVKSGGKIWYNESGEISISVPVTVYPNGTITAYGDTFQYLDAGNKCGQKLDLFRVAWILRQWVIGSVGHQRWTHEWERKLIFVSDVDMTVELYELEQEPGSTKYKPRDVVVKAGVPTEAFCSGIGGGCKFVKWQEQKGWTPIGWMVPNTSPGLDIVVNLNGPSPTWNPIGEPMDMPGGQLYIYPEWAAAQGVKF